MFCPNCGAQLPEEATFCPACGAAVAATKAQEPAQPAYQEPAYQEHVQAYEPVQSNDPEKTASARSAMIMAIVGLALAELGLPGIIVSAIARKKVKAYLATYGELTGMAKIANILSKVGVALSIVMTVFWVIYIIFVAIAAGVSVSKGFSSHPDLFY